MSASIYEYYEYTAPSIGRGVTDCLYRPGTTRGPLGVGETIAAAKAVGTAAAKGVLINCLRRGSPNAAVVATCLVAPFRKSRN
jgi:hypothetical protein